MQSISTIGLSIAKSVFSSAWRWCSRPMWSYAVGCAADASPRTRTFLNAIGMSQGNSRRWHGQIRDTYFVVNRENTFFTPPHASIEPARP